MRKKIIDNKILDLAFDTENYGLKNKSKYIAVLKNKKCGDKVHVELEIKNKKIKKMYYETESCIFCQASASLLSKKIRNLSVTDLDNLIENKIFKKLLSKKYINRRDCILLPLNALKKAI